MIRTAHPSESPVASDDANEDLSIRPTPLDLRFLAATDDVPACRGQSPDLWFPENPGAEGKFEQARQLCDGCVFRVECLRLAKRNRAYGVWGGVYLENGKESALPKPRGGSLPQPPTPLWDPAGFRVDVTVEVYSVCVRVPLAWTVPPSDVSHMTYRGDLDRRLPVALATVPTAGTGIYTADVVLDDMGAVFTYRVRTSAPAGAEASCRSVTQQALSTLTHPDHTEKVLP
jgi:Transcription factor WhiB